MTHTTRWSEKAVLDYFWAMVRADADRVALLKQVSDVRLERPSDWDMKAIRDAVNKRGPAIRLVQAQQCFTCLNAEHWLYWHHIVQVQHGGTNTPSNLVSLCHTCHQRVHPWLMSPTTVENRFGWTAIGDMAGRAVRTLERVWERARVERARAIPPDDQPF